MIKGDKVKCDWCHEETYLDDGNLPEDWVGISIQEEDTDTGDMLHFCCYPHWEMWSEHEGMLEDFDF